MTAPDQPPVVLDEENPEWTDEDFERARPATEVLPPEVVDAFATRSQLPGTDRAERE